MRSEQNYAGSQPVSSTYSAWLCDCLGRQRVPAGAWTGRDTEPQWRPQAMVKLQIQGLSTKEALWSYPVPSLAHLAWHPPSVEGLCFPMQGPVPSSTSQRPLPHSPCLGSWASSGGWQHPLSL